MEYDLYLNIMARLTVFVCFMYVCVGLMIRPKGSSMEIQYSKQNTESWDKYVKTLNSFLTPYDNSQQVMNNDPCTPDKYFIQEDSGSVRNNPKRSCQFNRTVLGDCDGLTDPNYGYRDGKPCIFIKLNRVIGMLPGKDGQSPYVTCGAKRYKVGEDEWVRVFACVCMCVCMCVNYSQPLVAVKFLNLTLNTDVNVECKINSNTISDFSERDKFAGRVSFKLRVED
uniref:Sodium/potassium-transporting ATPase subunit beta-2 n=1 Tax=Astyanax mexicanus TaxID=7994 RepID=A0A8B9H8H2_ASTMX